MPITELIVLNTDTQLIIWNVTETNEDLLKDLHLSEERKKKFDSLSEKRKSEFLGIRSCLKEMKLDTDIKYLENGKPYISDDKNISLSHSYGMVAVGAAKNNIGIDIELERTEKILNIKDKFVRKDEAVFIPKSKETEFLHVIWGIKEGLYKINGGNLWNFLHHYKIEPFDLIEGKPIVCWVTDAFKSEKFYGYYKKINNYYLIWVLEDEPLD